MRPKWDCMLIVLCIVEALKALPPYFAISLKRIALAVEPDSKYQQAAQILEGKKYGEMGGILSGSTSENLPSLTLPTCPGNL